MPVHLVGEAHRVDQVAHDDLLEDLLAHLVQRRAAPARGQQETEVDERSGLIGSGHPSALLRALQ